MVSLHILLITSLGREGHCAFAVAAAAGHLQQCPPDWAARCASLWAGVSGM